MDLNSFKFSAPRRSTAATLALLCAFIFPASQSLAQSSQASGFQLSSDDPINIDADQFEVDDTSKLITFTGNVVAVQGDSTVKAGKMTVRYAGGSSGLASGKGDIEKIDLSDSVKLETDTQKATGDTGYFDMTAQQFVLLGDQVVLTEEGNVFVGCKLTVNMTTSKAQLDACGKRVQVRLNPQSKPGN